MLQNQGILFAHNCQHISGRHARLPAQELKRQTRMDSVLWRIAQVGLRTMCTNSTPNEKNEGIQGAHFFVSHNIGEVVCHK